VFVQVKKNKTAASAKAFLSAVYKACPMRIQKVLTDNVLTLVSSDVLMCAGPRSSRTAGRAMHFNARSRSRGLPRLQGLLI
jgi:transposase-like protein